MIRRPPRSTRTDTLFPYTTLFRSDRFGTAQTQVLASGEKLGRENCLGLAYDSVHGAVGRELAPDIVRLLILTEGKLRSTQVAQRLSKCKMKLDPMEIVAGATQGALQQRSEERRVGKECVSTCRS